MIRLEVLEGQNKGQVAEVPGQVLSIGRAGTNHLVLTDWHISGEHGRIVFEGSHYVYRDLHSTNGSAVLRAEKRMVVGSSDHPDVTLTEGDRLLLGDASSPVIIGVTVRIPAEAASSAASAASIEPARTMKGISFDEVRQATGSESGQVIAVKTLDELAEAAGKLEADPTGIAALYSVTKRLSGRLELSEVLEATIESVFALVPRATHVAILLTEGSASPRGGADSGGPERLVPVLARERDSQKSTEIPLSRAVAKRVVADRAAVLVANAPEELGGSESILGGKIMSTMGIPLGTTDGDGPIRGLLQVDNRTSSGIFKERDLELCGVLAGQVSLAIENARLFSRVKIAEEKATKENKYLKNREEKRSRFADIIGKASSMQKVFKQLEKVIDTRVTVCIEGETGTGKELIASAIHYQGNRRDKLFVAQNCAALPETLLESELFGHKRGAFTGADHDKKGLFEIADGGSMFLDEIGEMGMNLQAKLLRVLQEGEVRPLGASATKTIDVRIICATNRDLEKEVEKGTFRQDLFYRLKVFPINLPPLRERRDDIPLLAQHFLARYMNELKKPMAGFSQPALDQMVNYNWPGNIRELENEIQRLVIQGDSDSFILPEHLSGRIRKVESLLDRIAPKKGTLKEMMDDVEKWLLAEALREHGHNKTKTAESLGITREGLHKKLSRYGLG